MTSTRIKYLFTYGSLKSDAICLVGAEERAVLRKEAEFVARGNIAGLLYDVGPYPGALLENRSAARIHGEIWSLPRERTQLMDMLDRYEGCAPSSPAPHSYSRRKVRIRLECGRRVVAWMYLWNGAVRPEARILGGLWEGPGRTVQRSLSEPSQAHRKIAA